MVLLVLVALEPLEAVVQVPMPIVRGNRLRVDRSELASQLADVVAAETEAEVRVAEAAAEWNRKALPGQAVLQVQPRKLLLAR
jgi:hypothetical protein